MKTLKIQNARLSQRLKLVTAEREVAKKNKAFYLDALTERNEEVDKLKQEILELKKQLKAAQA